jgi:hypothetical protein
MSSHTNPQPPQVAAQVSGAPAGSGDGMDANAVAELGAQSGGARLEAGQQGLRGASRGEERADRMAGRDRLAGMRHIADARARS